MTLKTNAFTLIELIIVIAIMGILASILIPSVGKVLEQAHKAKAAHQLRQIALAFINYRMGSGYERVMNADDFYDWALQLAIYGNANDTDLYLWDFDPLVNESIITKPQTIATYSSDTWTLNESFRNFTPSVVVVNKVPSGADPAHTPIAWSRGLQSDGTWHSNTTEKTPGLYKNGGGHIVFLDGHVSFYENLTNDDNSGKLIDYDSGEPTSNIFDAISSRSEVFPNR